MDKRIACLVGTFLALIAFQVVGIAQDTQSGHGQPEPPMAGVHWAKGQGPAHSQAGQNTGSPNLINHGGPVLGSGTTVVPIFWGSSWGNGNFVGDKISG